jgi:hypothetical protein
MLNLSVSPLGVRGKKNTEIQHNRLFGAVSTFEVILLFRNLQP